MIGMDGVCIYSIDDFLFCILLLFLPPSIKKKKYIRYFGMLVYTVWKGSFFNLLLCYDKTCLVVSAMLKKSRPCARSTLERRLAAKCGVVCMSCVWPAACTLQHITFPAHQPEFERLMRQPSRCARRARAYMHHHILLNNVRTTVHPARSGKKTEGYEKEENKIGKVVKERK